MNLPNLITLSRFFFAGLLMWCVQFQDFLMTVIAFVVFLIGCLSDYLDGYLARKWNQITPFGQLLDPIADKVLTFAAFISFVELGILPAWMVLMIIARDVGITGMRLLGTTKGILVPADRGGKHKTILQLVSIGVILFYLIVRAAPAWNPDWNNACLLIVYYLMLVVVGVTLWTGVNYMRRHWNRIVTA